jgi:hypothetical protein
MPTAPEGASATVFRLRHRNASARDVFVATVNAALPARDADERHRDGAALVVVLPGSTGGTPRTPFWAAEEFWLMIDIGLLVVGWIAGLVTLIVHIDIFGAILYFFGTKPLITGFSCTACPPRRCTTAPSCAAGVSPRSRPTSAIVQAPL